MEDLSIMIRRHLIYFALFLCSIVFFPFNGFSQVCVTPNNVSTTNISNFSAILNWDFDSTAHHYRLRYRESGSSSWQYNHNVPSLGFFNLSVAISGASSFMVRNFGIKNI